MMGKKYMPDSCKYCGSENTDVVPVDENLDVDNYAVRCNCCWAEGPHCVTEEMAVRMWGLAPETAKLKIWSE